MIWYASKCGEQGVNIVLRTLWSNREEFKVEVVGKMLLYTVNFNNKNFNCVRMSLRDLKKVERNSWILNDLVA